MADQRPILVTSSCRSGSTWVGRMLASSPGMHYVHEPLKRRDAACFCGLKIERWFPYITEEMAPAYQRHLDHLIGGTAHALGEIRQIRSARDLHRWAGAKLAARLGHTFVIKDPLAFFSADWLQAAFHARVVILVRHPAAVVSSYKRLNWSHQFTDFLSQPGLMAQVLQPFAEEITEYATRPPGIVDQAALLWRLVYATAARQRALNPDWIFVRHENLARNPITGFRRLYAALDVEFDSNAERAIKETGGTDKPADPADPYTLERNSQASVTCWRARLTPDEIARVRENTADVWPNFYSHEDW